MLILMKFDEKYAISNDKNSGNSALVGVATVIFTSSSIYTTINK